jgi:hypothetical protein
VWMSVGGGGIRDVGSLKMHACERAVYAVLAGKPIRDESGGGGGEGERGGGGGRDVMRAADVLRKWEDELWFEARGIFTREVSLRFSGRAPSDVTYMLRQVKTKTLNPKPCTLSGRAPSDVTYMLRQVKTKTLNPKPCTLSGRAPLRVI